MIQSSKSELRVNAEKLELALGKIVNDLGSNNLIEWENVSKRYLAELMPIMHAYSNALHNEESVELASKAISEVTPIVRRLSNLESRGCFNFQNSGIDGVETFHELCTIFREIKYRGQDIKK
jgi:hypothetical protein